MTDAKPEDPYGFKARLAAQTLEELIDAVNRQVGNRGWTSSRASYLSALRLEFLKRDVDTSSFISETGMSLGNRIELRDGRLVPIGEPTGGPGIIAIDPAS